MIVVTGALGFIGSALIKQLNMMGHFDILAVDDFYQDRKNPNIDNKKIREFIHRDIFIPWFERIYSQIDFVFHLGARTDTAEMDTAIFDRLNLNYSKDIWRLCAQHDIPLVYASSAATYGIGDQGFDDKHSIVKSLKPLNLYGVSKNDFDIWALAQKKKPPFWAGIKFFNVYGPNEYHKSRMASVILHTVRQIKKTGGMKLFRSHHKDYKDGEQKRDFVYIKDVVDVLYFMMEKQPKSGLYNLGTGKARTFYDLAANTFDAMNLKPNISFIDTPLDIRDKYQYFTQANMSKLKKAGYTKSFTSLEDGINDYVKKYLLTEKIW